MRYLSAKPGLSDRLLAIFTATPVSNSALLRVISDRGKALAGFSAQGELVKLADVLLTKAFRLGY